MYDLLSQLAGALILVGGLFALGLTKLLCRPGTRLAPLGPALVFGAAAALLGYVRAPGPAWLALGLVAALGVGCYLLVSPRTAAVGAAVLGGLRRPRLQGAMLLLLAPLLGLAWLGRLPTEAPDDAPQDPRTTKLAQVLKVRPQPALAFYTDRGRHVPAYQPVLDDLNPDELPDLEDFLVKRRDLSVRLIRLAGPDPAYNCHGWTFAGGRCWIRTEEAELVLRDNGYQAVAAPRAGDLVVYRLEDGTLAHTGVVTAVVEGGSVLVESKWGWAGLYVHPAETQPYSERWEYFRSARDGHWLCGTPEPAGRPLTE
jgi:hypothetical protein